MDSDVNFAHQSSQQLVLQYILDSQEISAIRTNELMEGQV